MDLHRKAIGRCELRWRESGRYRSRTFDRKRDAEQFDSDRRRRMQLGHAAVPEDVALREFTKTYRPLHAVPRKLCFASLGATSATHDPVRRH